MNKGTNDLFISKCRSSTIEQQQQTALKQKFRLFLSTVKFQGAHSLLTFYRNVTLIIVKVQSKRKNQLWRRASAKSNIATQKLYTCSAMSFTFLRGSTGRIFLMCEVEGPDNSCHTASTDRPLLKTHKFGLISAFHWRVPAGVRSPRHPAAREELQGEKVRHLPSSSPLPERPGNL